MFTLEKKQDLCRQLSTLTDYRAKEVFNLISNYAKSNPKSVPKRLGSKGSIPFCGKRIQDDYQFDLNLFPDELIVKIEELIE